MHVGSVMIFRPGEAGLDWSRLVRHVEARIALVPRYRQRVRFVPGRHRQSGLGRRRALRHQLPHAPLRAAPAGLAGPARGARRPGAGAPARPVPPAVGAHRRRGPRGRRVRGAHQGAPDAGGRRQRGGPRPGRPRRRRGRARAPAAHLAPRPRAEFPSSWSPRRVNDTLRRPQQARRHGPGRHRRPAQHRWPGRRGARRARPLGPHPHPQPAERGDRRSPSVRDARHRPGGLSPDPRAPPAPVASTATRGTTTVNDVVLATLAGALRTWLQGRGLGIARGTSSAPSCR